MPKQVVGFHIDKTHAATSLTAIQGIESDDRLKFLSKFVNTINIFYSLDFSVACILRSLNLKYEQLQTLLNQNKMWFGELQLTYIPSKYFAFRYGKEYTAPYVAFSDASQLLNVRVEEGNQEYCFKKAQEAQKCGQEFYNTLTNTLKITNCDSLISPIQQFSKHMLPRFNFSNVDDVPEEAGQYAFECADFGLFEDYVKGKFAETHDYDINSSYPSQLAELPELRQGDFKHVTEMTDAPMGFYKGKVTIKSNFSPIGYKFGVGEKRKNFTPIGTWERYCTRNQIDFIRKWNIGDFEMEDGWEWTPDGFTAPLNPLIKRLYELKEQNTGIPKQVIKKILNGLWGKLGEVRNDDSFGDYFNPIYYTLTESNARLKVIEACLINNVVPIAIAVDGITVDRPLELEIGTGLGQWKLAYEKQPCIAVNADLILIKSKDSEQLFTVTYEWMENEINKDPETAIYSMTQPSPVTLGKAINLNDIEHLGDIVPTTRYIDVPSDIKRLFKSLPNSGRDLLNNKYESLPLSVDTIELMELPEINEDTLLTNRD